MTLLMWPNIQGAHVAAAAAVMHRWHHRPTSLFLKPSDAQQAGAVSRLLSSLSRQALEGENNA